MDLQNAVISTADGDQECTFCAYPMFPGERCFFDDSGRAFCSKRCAAAHDGEHWPPCWAGHLVDADGE